MSIILYGHRLSQPCRAVEILLRELETPYTWREVDFAQGATREPWYVERINVFATVPALVVTPEESASAANEFRLSESHAIMRYLCRMHASGESADAWYPGDHNPARAARIDQWLDWHQTNVRRYDMFHHIMNLHFTLPMLKREIQATLLKPLQGGLQKSLAVLESRLDARNADSSVAITLCGEREPTIADLAIVCELYQIVAIGYRFDRFPTVQRWLDELSARPHFRDICHQIDEQGQTIRDQDAAYLDLEHAFAASNDAKTG